MEIISLKKKSTQPKYKQIVVSIETAIDSGRLKKGDKLPSLNAIKNNNNLSRDTVLNAFKELKNRGIINSVVGKGYYVFNENVTVKQKVFLLFDELNSFKEDLYNSFLDNLEKNIQVDIFFHHFNIDVFENLISNNVGNYNYYVIMPANLKGTDKVISTIPKDKVYILDQTQKELNKYAAIFQNFEKDFFNGLEACLNEIKNYKKLVLSFSNKKQPDGIVKGFKIFCKRYNIQNNVVSSLEELIPQKGEVYIILEDKNLIRIIKKIKETKFILAKDVGIISFNDSLLKEIVEGGITTISTDFNWMGKRLAEMILNNEQVRIENPSQLIVRKSI